MSIESAKIESMNDSRPNSELEKEEVSPQAASEATESHSDAEKNSDENGAMSEEEQLLTKPLCERIQLPEPDHDNITVLTGKLPNKPILPWNRYDSPWREEEARREAAEAKAAAEAEEGDVPEDEAEEDVEGVVAEATPDEEEAELEDTQVVEEEDEIEDTEAMADEEEELEPEAELETAEEIEVVSPAVEEKDTEEVVEAEVVPPTEDVPQDNGEEQSQTEGHPKEQIKTVVTKRVETVVSYFEEDEDYVEADEEFESDEVE